MLSGEQICNINAKKGADSGKGLLCFFVAKTRDLPICQPLKYEPALEDGDDSPLMC